MKWLSGLIAIITIALFITNPGVNDFNNFIKPINTRAICKREANYLVFSKYQCIQDYTIGSYALPAAYVKYEYIGILNEFWTIAITRYRAPDGKGQKKQPLPRVTAAIH